MQIQSKYKDRSTLDPHHARHDDIFKKLGVTTAKAAINKNAQFIRLEGCPVSVAEQVLTLVAVGGLKNPYMDPGQVSHFTRSYLGWRSRVALNLLQRKRYQTNGTFAHRGHAAPDIRA